MKKGILKFLKENFDVGYMMGSYVVNRHIPIEYNDVDFFTYLPKKCLLDSNYVFEGLAVKDEVEIGGCKFKLNGQNYNKEFEFVSYKNHDDFDEILNIIMILQPRTAVFPVYDLMKGFDLDILRVAYNPFNDTDLKLHHFFDQCVETKVIRHRVLLERFKSWHDPKRVEKYKEKLPGYSFVKEL